MPSRPENPTSSWLSIRSNPSRATNLCNPDFLTLGLILYADRIKDLNTRIARISQSTRDALDDAKRAEQSEDILRQQLNQELETLKEEWDEYKRPIDDEIFENKQSLADRRVEYQYKNDKIKELKKDFKQAISDSEHKKKVLSYMEQEWQQLPKDVNRNQYLKRINEIIKTLKE